MHPSPSTFYQMLNIDQTYLWEGIPLCQCFVRSLAEPQAVSSRLEKKQTCDSVLSDERNRWEFEHVIRNSITVIPVIRRSQGCTPWFRPLTTRRWFAPWKSSRSAFFSATAYDLRSLLSGTCLDTKTPRAFRWKRAFSTCISTLASLCLCSWWLDWKRSQTTK